MSQNGEFGIAYFLEMEDWNASFIFVFRPFVKILAVVHAIQHPVSGKGP